MFLTRRLLPVPPQVQFLMRSSVYHATFAIFGIAAAALMASFASANAQQSVQAGILQCQGGQNVGSWSAR